MNNDDLNSKSSLSDFSIENYNTEELILLCKVKEYVNLEQHKDHSYLKIHKWIYDYFLRDVVHVSTARQRKEWERIASLVFLFIHFSNPRDMIVSFTEKELGKILGVSERTIQRYVRKSRNHFFNVLSGDNVSSFHSVQEGKAEFILPNKYELLVMNMFGKLKKFPDISAKDSWVRIKVAYKKKDYKEKTEKSDNNTIKKTHSLQHSNSKSKSTYKGRHEIAQNTDMQVNNTIIFEHFNNPIYQLKFDFDPWNTPYPSNWCRHPDIKAYFKTGRWTGGAIHNMKREVRKKYYLNSIGGLTHEIDLHNAIFYFLIAFLPDTVSMADKERYCDKVKSGKLYNDAVDYWTYRPGESDGFAAEALKGIEIAPDREEFKKLFQRYLNNAGKRKLRIPYIDPYFEQKFPTIRDWLLQVKEKIAVWLFWIETDFMSYFCEKLSAENIRFEWLHDGVYVSEENGARAEVILDSVKKEFERAFSF
jgi:hypothetical protein